MSRSKNAIARTILVSLYERFRDFQFPDRGIDAADLVDDLSEWIRGRKSEIKRNLPVVSTRQGEPLAVLDDFYSRFGDLAGQTDEDVNGADLVDEFGAWLRGNQSAMDLPDLPFQAKVLYSLTEGAYWNEADQQWGDLEDATAFFVIMPELPTRLNDEHRVLSLGPLLQESQKLADASGAELDEKQIADFIDNLIQSGNIKLEEIPRLMARYALSDPTEMRAEFAERMGLDESETTSPRC